MIVKIGRYGDYKMNIIKYSSFSEIEKQWMYLYSKQYKPFQHPDVIKATDTLAYKLKLLAKGIHSHVHYYACYDNNEIVMIVPIRHFSKGNVSVLGSIEDYEKVELLYDPNFKFDKLIREFFLYLKDCGCKKIIWKHLPEYSEQYKCLNKIEYELKKMSNISVSIPFHEGHDVYFRNLKKNVRQNIRTAYNRVHRNNNTLKFEIFMAKDMLDNKSYENKYKEYTDVYIKRRMERYKVCGFIHKIFAEKYHYLAKSYRSDNGFLAGISINGVTAACMEGYISNYVESMEVPRLAINNNFGFYSPGILLINEVIKYLANNTKIRKLDLCGGDEKYKLDCGGIVYLTADIEIKL